MSALVLVRHGQTAANVGGLLVGHADPPLSEVGRAQAVAIGAYLRGATPAVIVSSPLARTMQTAGNIAAQLGIGVEVEPDLIEMNYGEWDERPIADVPAEVWLRWRSDADFAPPGGESLREVQQRVGACAARLLARTEEALVVAVSHVSPIKAAVLWALGLDATPELAWRLRLDLASLTRIAGSPYGPVLVSFNELVPGTS